MTKTPDPPAGVADLPTEAVTDLVLDHAFYKLDEVAELLRVSRRTVDYLVRSGELKSLKVRSNRRVPREGLLAYLAQAEDDDSPTVSESHQQAARRSRRERTSA